MSQITRFNLNALSNGNYYQYIKSFVSICKAEPLMNTPLSRLVASLELLQSSFKKEQLTAETLQVTEADVLRDRAFSKINKFIEGYGFDDRVPENKAAAEIISNLLTHYGRELIRFDYNKESAYLTNLIKDIHDNAQDAVNTLGLGEDIEYLKTCNDNFIALYAKRGEAAQTLANIPPFYKLRKDVNRQYNTLVVYIESVGSLDPTLAPKMEALIGRINVEIEKYKLLLTKPAEKKPETPTT